MAGEPAGGEQHEADEPATAPPPGEPPIGIGSFAGRKVDYGEFRAIPVQFEASVDATPERPAVTYDRRTLTYRELDELVNGQALTLAGHGVGRGDTVPVLLVNSLELPVAYLALMKLGAAFVPLDPAWPEERLRAALGVLADGPVLCAVAESVPEEFRHRAITIDIERVVPVARRPSVTLRPDDVIYGYFTSGTTGTPKCAMNRHAGMVNRLHFMTRCFGAAGAEVVLQNSKHTFDSSLWQLFWPLTTGGRVVLPLQGEFLDLQHIIDTIAAHRITTADFVSSIFNALVGVVDGDEEALRKLSSLRCLVVGSEPLNPSAVHRMMTLLPGVQVTNGYGPTEASIGMVFHAVSPADGDLIPLGRPIDNCYVAVVDDDLRPVPYGATGEIAIGGVCLGTGYLGDPTATAKVFVPNPFPDRIPGDRIYLTGDLGHMDGTGRLYFSGRKDFQVKIGGVRIELGEIAVAAERCPGVQQAEVLVAEQAGTRSLALFASGDGLTATALRAHLRRTLPRTSLPRHYLVLPDMPLNDNGKVDRGRLQEILDARLAEDSARLADGAPAAVPSERVLWVLRSVLGRPDLQADEHFAEAGGDSLQALSVVHALVAECEVPVGVQDLYEHPTAAALTRLIERRRRDGAAIESESVLMARDAVLPDGEPIRAAALPGDLRTVLMTGATGFVGSRILYELLVRTDLRVKCLVRAADDAQATARVVGALADRALWEPRFAGRVEGFAGDLARPGLGLATPIWDHLARSCDLVLHNGALVNFLFDYRAHRAVNVRGTVDLLRLAMAHRPVPLHYVSTLAVLEDEAAYHEDPLPEDFEVARARVPSSGYARSKWVAERVLADARRRGAIVTILRLGEVMPSEDNGFPNPVALTDLLLSSYLRLGVRPDVAIRSDYSPVDYVSARVVAAVHDRNVWNQTLHVLHPESVRFDDLFARAGVPVAKTSCSAFAAAVREAALTTGVHELTLLASLLPGRPGAPDSELKKSFGGLLTDNPALFRRDACRALEERWRLPDPPLDAAIKAYHAYLAARNARPLPGPAPVERHQEVRTG